jgi:hypothetical protein
MENFWKKNLEGMGILRKWKISEKEFRGNGNFKRSKKFS